MVDRLTKEQQEALKATPVPPIAPIPSLMDRILEQKAALLKMQANIHDQATGIANQLFLIDQLLNPKPVVTGAPPETDIASRADGSDTPPPSEPPGTI